MSVVVSHFAAVSARCPSAAALAGSKGHPPRHFHLYDQTSGAERAHAAAGAVTLIQRFGSAANFNPRFDILLYDLTSTYFEADPPDEGKRKYGYSRDKRPDCVQVVIALIVTLWEYYLQLTEVEQAFKELKGDLAIRPIYHQTDQRIEAHTFVAFVAYCLQVTLKQRPRSLAPGLTPRAVLETFSALQMVDVHLPTTDGRHLILPRYTQPEKDLQLLLNRLKLELPQQPPPKITAQDQANA